MRALKILLAAACVAPIAIHPSAATGDLGRQVLRSNDGFASIGDGVSGGADATRAQTFVVRERAELVAALGAGSTGAPRIIYVDGVINATSTISIGR